MAITQHVEQIVQTYKDKTVELQKKSEEIIGKSDPERQGLSAEIETTLSDLKRDMEILDVNLDVSEKSQLVNFETQLITIQKSLTSSPESNKNSSEQARYEQTWDWTKEKVTNAWNWIKENPGWTAVGVGTLGLGFLAYYLYKKRKAKKEASSALTPTPTPMTTGQQAPTIIINTGEKKNRWQRNWGRVVWTLGLAGAGYTFRDKLFDLPHVWPWLDKFFNKKMTMKEAIGYVEGNVVNKACEDHLRNNIRLSWDESSKKLSVFGQDFEVDTSQKKLRYQGKELGIQFKTFEDLITTAMIIGSAKNTFSGACANATPFSIPDKGGDLEVNLAEKSRDLVSGKWFPIGARTGGTLAVALSVLIGYVTGNIKVGLASWGLLTPTMTAGGALLLDNNDTLSKICPTLNEDLHKNKLMSFLNEIWGWNQGSIEDFKDRANTNNAEINQTFETVFKDIEGTEDPNDDQGSELGYERDPWIRNYAEKPGVFELQSWWTSCYLHIKSDRAGKISEVYVEDVGNKDEPIKFTWTKAISEALHVASFINKCEKELAGKWDQKDPFMYNSRFYIGFRSWIYFDKDWTPIDDWLLSKDTIKTEIPTLLQGNNMDMFIKRLNTRMDRNGGSLWTKKSWRGGRRNTYLKSLSEVS